MNVFILTEGGNNIGFGHITRCLSIYQAFEQKKITVEFLLNADETVIDLIKGKKYRLLNWLNNEDILLNLIKDADIVLIDSYLAKIDLYRKIQETANLTVYIDDNKRLDYPGGIMINGTIFAEDLNYPFKNEIKYLLGSRYIPLRQEFWAIPEKSFKNSIESIMITFGGDDLTNSTPRILSMLINKYPQLKKKVIVGKGFKNINEIHKFTDKNTELIYYPNANEMKKIMLESDIAISAAGQTLYELARTGVPVIAVGVAANQKNNIKGWQKADFIEFGGWWDDPDLPDNLEKCINRMEDVSDRKSKSLAGKNFVDGQGSLRVVEELLKL